MQAFIPQNGDQIKTSRKQKQSQLKEQCNCLCLIFTFTYSINIPQSTDNYELNSSSQKLC